MQVLAHRGGGPRRLLVIAVAFLLALSSGQTAWADEGVDQDTLLQMAGVSAPSGDAPTASGAEVEIAGQRVVIGGAGSPRAKGGRQQWKDKSVTHVAQRTSDGGQLISIFAKNRGIERVRYEFPGRELQLFPNGAISVVDPTGDGALVAVIKPPWAKDATGAPVNTWYEVSGTTLTQVVAPSKATQYPVVADPTAVSTWYGWQVRFNKDETNRMATGFAACAAVAGRVQVIGPYLAGSCAALMVWSATAVVIGKCVAVNVVNVPRALTPWYRGC